MLQWRKYCREIGRDKPLLLDREQNRVGMLWFAWQKLPRLSTIGTGFSPHDPFLPPKPEHDSMAALGRLGQFLGLAIPAVAVLLELNHAITLGQMLVMLVAAVCCFWIGRILEGYSRNA